MDTPEPQPPPTRRKRRWFQYSLRALLVVVLLASVGMSWFAVRMQRARRQREAIEAITALGGRVVYDDELDLSSDRPLYGRTSETTWLEELLGRDFSSGVLVVELDGGRVTDDHLEHLAALSNLQCLSLADAQITDAGMKQLKGLNGLRALSLGRTQVTDAGLEHLERLTRLKGLDLKGTAVTDKGVKKLQQALPNCKVTR